MTVIFVLPLSLKAQKDLPEEELKRLTRLSEELEGTYQVQMVNTRKLPAFPLTLLERIHELRDAKDTVYLRPYPEMRIMILPEKIIRTPGFLGIDKFSHISLNQ